MDVTRMYPTTPERETQSVPKSLDNLTLYLVSLWFKQLYSLHFYYQVSLYLVPYQLGLFPSGNSMFHYYWNKERKAEPDIFNWVIPSNFFLYFRRFNIVLNVIDSKWLDSNRISFSVGGNSFTNWATTTALETGKVSGSFQHSFKYNW